MTTSHSITPSGETYLRFQEFAALLNVARQTVYHWSCKGLLVTVGPHGSPRVALNATLKRMAQQRQEAISKFRERQGWVRNGQKTLLPKQQPATRLRDGSDDGPTG